MVPSMTRKRPALVEGLTAGVERAGFPVLGRGAEVVRCDDPFVTSGAYRTRRVFQ